MSFKVGDKVNFLNETGGGIVTKIVSNKVVNVAIEDGFEIPTMVSNLVLVDGAKNADIKLNQKISNEIEKKVITSQDLSNTAIYLSEARQNKKAEGLYIAFEPENQTTVLSGNLNVFFINFSEFQTFYTLFLNVKGDFVGKDAGKIEPKSKIKIASIEREEIEKWCNGIIQIMFYQKGKTEIFKPITQTINVKPVRFYKEDNFINDVFLGKKAFTISLIDFNTIKPYNWANDINETTEIIVKDKIEKQNTEVFKSTKISFLSNHMIERDIAEVDLHIDQLLDDITGLTNADMLKYQTDYFLRSLETAIRERLSKIIFIHGVGNGVLKTELVRLMASNPYIRFQDASLAKYGVGATEVIILQNKK